MTLLDLVLRNEDYCPGTVLQVWVNGHDNGTMTVNDLIYNYSACDIISFGKHTITLAERRNDA